MSLIHCTELEAHFWVGVTLLLERAPSRQIAHVPFSTKILNLVFSVLLVKVTVAPEAYAPNIHGIKLKPPNVSVLQESQ